MKNISSLLLIFVFLIVGVGAQAQVIIDNNNDSNTNGEFDAVNPISFTFFKLRTNNKKEKAVLIEPSNNGNTYDVSSNSSIMVQFDMEQLADMESSPSIKMFAYVDSGDSTFRPLSCFGHSVVTTDVSDEYDFNNILLNENDSTSADFDFFDLYQLTVYERFKSELGSTQIDLTKGEFKNGDKIIVTIINPRNGGIGFTMTFLVNNEI